MDRVVTFIYLIFSIALFYQISSIQDYEKNKLLAFVLLVVSIASIYSAYKIFMSASYQTFLMWDFNNETHDTPYEIYAEKLDANYPNLTFTSSNEVYTE